LIVDTHADTEAKANKASIGWRLVELSETYTQSQIAGAVRDASGKQRHVAITAWRKALQPPVAHAPVL
jgi:hypothetical protein